MRGLASPPAPPSRTAAPPRTLPAPAHRRSTVVMLAPAVPRSTSPRASARTSPRCLRAPSGCSSAARTSGPPTKLRLRCPRTTPICTPRPRLNLCRNSTCHSCGSDCFVKLHDTGPPAHILPARPGAPKEARANGVPAAAAEGRVGVRSGELGLFPRPTRRQPPRPGIAPAGPDHGSHAVHHRRGYARPPTLRVVREGGRDGRHRHEQKRRVPRHHHATRAHKVGPALGEGGLTPY
mmetsp:Transcript_146666/g.470624  ORF Transcript_146666/g.470624 Transcript_146666/m.470624 type:complete len:236 (+) Transcript_146666:146-853(+)